MSLPRHQRKCAAERRRTRHARPRKEPTLHSRGTNVPMHHAFTLPRTKALKAAVIYEAPVSGVREQEWLRDHWREHIGQWVALQGNQLVGEAVSAREALEQARASGHRSPFLVHVTELSKLPFGGW
jgi:hypothetical protein